MDHEYAIECPHCGVAVDLVVEGPKKRPDVYVEEPDEPSVAPEDEGRHERDARLASVHADKSAAAVRARTRATLSERLDEADTDEQRESLQRRIDAIPED